MTRMIAAGGRDEYLLEGESTAFGALYEAGHITALGKA